MTRMFCLGHPLRRPLVVGLTALLLSVSPSSAEDAQPTEDQLLHVAGTAVARDNLEPLGDIEEQSIPAARGRALRDGEELSLQLASGATKVFTDRPECRPDSTDEARCETYRLVTYLDGRGMILVAHFFYEDLRFILVDGSSGRETELSGLPQFSPSGKYVLVLDNDINNGSEVQVWARKGDALRLASKGAPMSGGMFTTYRLEEWADDGVISIEATTAYAYPDPEVIQSFELHRAGSRWQVVGDSPHKSVSELRAIADDIVRTTYPDMDLSELRSTVRLKESRAYLEYSPNQTGTTGGGAIVALDWDTGEFLGSQLTQ